MAETLSSRAYRKIHRKLVAGELAAGHVVSEELLAKELGMSRTPVREAIRRLQSQGLVEQVPRRGTIVRSIERQDVEELFEVRMALESHAAARAAGRIIAADLEVLEKLCDEARAVSEAFEQSGEAVLGEKELQRLLATDMAFHMVLIRASGNHRMMRIMGESQLLARMFHSYCEVSHDLKMLRRAEREHRRILKAVKEGDADFARTLMVEHLAVGQADALTAWDARQQRPQTRPEIAMPRDLLDELGDIELSWDEQHRE